MKRVMLTVAGFSISAAILASVLKTHPITLVGLIFLSPVGVIVGNELGQGKVEKCLKKVSKELSDTQMELRDAQSKVHDFDSLLVRESQLKKDYQSLETQLQKLHFELSSLKQALTVSQTLIQSKDSENVKLTQQVSQLNDQLNDWIDNFDESVATAGEEKFQEFKSLMLGEIKEKYHTAIANHADLIEMARSLKDKAVQGCYYMEEQNRNQREYFLKVFDQYEAVNSASVDEKNELLVQIEVLKQKCIRLELKLSGVLPEP
ncbi:MAG: hypothetical protein F6J92_29465, partial [Symploca sp. SIO1A3]|nr:hypothetical protein [Symploca sp. SIO1A3]